MMKPEAAPFATVKRSTKATTIAPTMLKGSPKENVLPQDATAWINYRIAPGDSSDKVMAKAKEELGHARSGSNELRKIALAQHIDETVSYLCGQGIEIEAPETRAEGGRQSYLLESVPAFFGRVRCVLDQWHASHMIELYDEMVTLVKLKKQVPTAD